MQPEAEISIMASAAAFKQQCPSCEALVPIRDPDLIGRKIDCPKCKYRFIVEDPADADAESTAKAKKSDEKGGKKPVKGKAKRRSDEEDEKSSKGGSNKVLIGALVGGVALIALAITAYFLFLSDDGSSASKGGGSTAANTPAKSSVPDEPEEKKPVVEEKPAPTSTAEMVTNLLPPDTEGVCSVKLHNFMRAPLGHAVFAAPGTFLAGGLEKNLGFAPGDVDLFLQAWNFTNNWTYSVIHASKAFDKNAIITALKLKPADGKIQDQEYFVADANPWLDALGKAAFAKLVQTSNAKIAPRQGKLGARFYDDQTLVLADMVPLQALLNVKGNFEQHKPVKTEEKKDDNAAGAAAADGDGKGAAMAAANANAARKRMTMGGDGPGAAALGDSPGGGAQQPDAKPAETEPKVKESGSFLTISAPLKAMLDRLDTKQPILALAVESQPAKAKIAPLSVDPLGFDVVIKDSQVVGAAIVWKDHLTFLMSGDQGSEDGAKRRFRDLEKKTGKDLTTKIGKILGVPVEFLNEQDENDPFGGETGGPGAAGAGFGGAGLMPGGLPGGRAGGMSMPGGPPPNITRRGGRMGGGGRDLDPGDAPPSGFNPGARGRPGAGIMPGGLPGFVDPNNPPPPPKEPAKATAKFTVQENTVVTLTVELLDGEASGTLLNKIVRPAMVQEKGALDMSGGRNRVFELAAATQRLAEANQRQFPRATLERQAPASRAGRAYPPNQRVSWMAELLPYFGQNALYAQINRSQSWNDPDNVATASTLVPQFLVPNTPQESWWVKYPKVADPVAATHYVGIAGVGLDAASYAANDPAVADKIGIFGYDRQTAIRDIVDGAGNTILLAQVSPLVKRPWMAGGGATAVGVPEKNSIKPFVSTQSNGKKGTMVVMADGSVRFISETCSDEVFKALSTIKGNESVILNREAPKVEPLPDELVADASAPPSSAPPAVQPASAEPAGGDPQAGASKEYVSKEGKFKVTFPAGKRQDQKMSQDTPIGKIDIFISAVESKPGEAYTVMYNDFPPNVPLDFDTALENEAILGAVRAQVTAKAPGSKITSEKKVKVDGKDALELMIEVPGQANVRDTFFFSGKRQFQLIVSGPKDAVEGKDANAFTKSFKFVK
jgi:hypothetical protein